MSGKWKGSRNKPDGGDQEWVSPHHWMLAVLPLALDQVPSGPEVGRVPSGEGGPGDGQGCSGRGEVLTANSFSGSTVPLRTGRE